VRVDDRALWVFKCDSYQLSQFVIWPCGNAFSERLPIGPPWRLRGQVSLILAGALEDKQTSVLCYWRGAELFTKAFVLSHSYSPPFHPIASYSSHILPLTLISVLCFMYRRLYLYLYLFLFFFSLLFVFKYPSLSLFPIFYNYIVKFLMKEKDCCTI